MIDFFKNHHPKFMTRVSMYREMWLFVFFDLPVTTKKDRKNYQIFRKKLETDGFRMFQYSVYYRHCGSIENAEVHLKRVKSFLPEKGHISIIPITDKQFGNIQNFFGRLTEELPKGGMQLSIF
jgi:CRISPR-associated protein Cas2